MSKISNFFFLLSMVCIVLALVPIAGINIRYSILIVATLFFGLIAFVFSILGVFFGKNKKKSNKEILQSFVYYCGLLVIYAGLVFWIMHWPWSRELTIAGGAIVLVSYLIKWFFVENENNDQLLDN
jgi:vacuolar-type H+-ATPase subunit I/STV1